MQLDKIVRQDLVVPLENTFKLFEIDSNLRAAHFLSQIMHESGDFKRVEENLNYRDVNRLVAIFKRDFDSNKDRQITEEELEFAKQYVGKPEKIANFVYANQNGNGDEHSGDGWKYRGRGYIQLTGKYNYEKFAKFAKLDVLNNPDLLLLPENALLSAGWFWDSNKLNIVADKGATDSIVEEVTKRINAGKVGLDDRIKRFYKVYNLLNS